MLNIIPPDATPLKQCIGPCGQFLPATTDFFNRHQGKLHPRCKKCRSAERKATYVPKPRPNITPGYRVCAECRQEKLASIENFHRNGKNKLTHVCKDCWKAYVIRLAEKRAAKSQEPMQTCTGPCGRTLPATTEYFSYEVRGLRKRCKACRREEQRANYKQNEEARQAHRRIYDDANREAIRTYDRNRKAWKQASIGQHTVEDVQKQYGRQKGKCYWCGKKLGTGRRAYHVDHVIPLARGGSNGPDNLVIACPWCNQSKQDKLPHEWPEGGRLL